MRMEDGRMTKAVILGWMKELEGWKKQKGRKRKTICFWKKLLREAGIDWTDLSGATKDRKKWKKLVMERMSKLDKWEKSNGHQWTGGRMERNELKRTTTDFLCSVCGKSCKSKGGLVIHRRRMHEISEKRKVFECKACLEKFQQEANMLNHMKVCGGASASRSDRRFCACGREFAKSYIARHKKKCVRALAAEEEGEKRLPRVYKSARKVCDCGVEMAKTNFARHKREACPIR